MSFTSSCYCVTEVVQEKQRVENWVVWCVSPRLLCCRKLTLIYFKKCTRNICKLLTLMKRCFILKECCTEKVFVMSLYVIWNYWAVYFYLSNVSQRCNTVTSQFGINRNKSCLFATKLINCVGISFLFFCALFSRKKVRRCVCAFCRVAQRGSTSCSMRPHVQPIKTPVSSQRNVKGVASEGREEQEKKITARLFFIVFRHFAHNHKRKKPLLWQSPLDRKWPSQKRD